jgi:hypothetical protein
MEVLIERVVYEKSKINDNHYYHISGSYKDVENVKRRGHTYIDPSNDNYDKWKDIIETDWENRGFNLRVSNVKLLKDDGLWNADSTPRLEEIVDKPLNKKYMKPAKLATGAITDSDLFSL